MRTALALALAPGCGSRGNPHPPPPAGPHIQLRYELEPGAPAAGVARDATTLRARFVAAQLDDVVGVTADANGIVLDVANVPQDTLATVKAMTAPGALAFQVVDNDAPFMRGVFERASADVRAAEVTGEQVASAVVGTDPETGPNVALHLTPAGTAAFGALTARIAGRKLALVVDGVVLSAPSSTPRSPAAA